MSRFNRKGFRNLKVQDNETGRVADIAIRTTGQISSRHKAQLRKLEKQRKAEAREYKRQLREAKKLVPISERSKLNWAEITTPKQ